MKANICAHCGGIMEKKLITVDRRIEDRLFIFEHVPAEICSQCSSRWFSSEVLKDMDRNISESLEPARIEHIPVYSLAV